MTTKQADRIIKAGNIVVVRNAKYDDLFAALFVQRDRFNIYDGDGRVYDRAELEIVTN